ncbi:hypothetical protein BAUCODRAFT_212605 [Baudoinia panamericana UAMH 10762]|uniref:Inositol-pentakisphosphate 2-kinase n=1 Tax=Baudoinia panamericana (strain UAMH 10762) TaxID=717646 RepID=M2N519_BAUPA|nr:uncharacterized protein BAUCODRAFT_212605 [Baudoinia panamericana UAMH 10762]EMC93860.1 hypothetical protein BAUCODRAFT_212605 [Baudoinia panamericana UAMH 10762]
MPTTMACQSTLKVAAYKRDSDGLLEFGLSCSSDTVGRCELEYLAEGGANVLFMIRLEATCGNECTQSQVTGKLLRLRKANKGPQPSTQEVFQTIKQVFEPLFTAHQVLEHELVALSPQLIMVLDQHLSRLARPQARVGEHLDENEAFGILVPDMTPEPEEELLQFKPKWLAQSPSAPLESRRCRTCAFRARRKASSCTTSTDAQEVCPLALVSTSQEIRALAATALTSDTRLQAYVTDKPPILSTLLQKQQSLDPNGVLRVGDEAEEIARLTQAMTLRDCTLFVLAGRSEIVARLGDLDLKDAGKIAKWQIAETTLITEGWYTNEEAPGMWQPETICCLRPPQPPVKAP